MNLLPKRHASRAFVALPRAGIAALLMVLAALSGRLAHAGAILVGDSNDCTVHTIQAAIDRADGFGGYNLIYVTDDVADAVYHENLRFRDLHEGLELEIVGGFNNCRQLAPTAFGKASIYGGDNDAPALRVESAVNVKLRNLWIDSGKTGIEWIGRGSVALAGVTIHNNGAYGAYVSAANGTAELKLLGGVEILAHDLQGIVAWGSNSVISVRGDGNSIRQNVQGGIRLNSGALADIGATGKVISGNGGYGLAIDATNLQSARRSYLYSTDPSNPLRISGNSGGAISLLSKDSAYSLCAKNVSIDANAGGTIHLVGSQAHMEVNGDDCLLPAEANIACATPVGPGMCNAIVGNPGTAGTPLIAALDGASLLMRRVLITDNDGATLLSTNRGVSTNSMSAITLTDSVVIGNTLSDSLFEALGGGIVDIWDSTVKGNDGAFQFSFVGVGPRLLQVTNSIIDQSQGLVTLNAGSQAVTHFSHVLAHNRDGASVGDDILLGQPTYRDVLGRLAPESLGVDYSQAGGGTDFDGLPRDVDTLDWSDQYGPRDLGAFESQVIVLDRIFASGFERP